MIVDPGPASCSQHAARRARGRAAGAAPDPHPPRPRRARRASSCGASRSCGSTSTRSAPRTWSTRRGCSQSAGRLYGDEMERLWGEVAAGAGRANVTALEGGEEVEGFEVALRPGHAAPPRRLPRPESTATPTCGDVAGVRIPPSELVAAPTPPPEIDVEAWRESLRSRRARCDPAAPLHHPLRRERGRRGPARAAARRALRAGRAERASPGTASAFAAWLDAALRRRGRARSPSACARRCRPTSSGWASSATGASAARPSRPPEPRRSSTAPHLWALARVFPSRLIRSCFRSANPHARSPCCYRGGPLACRSTASAAAVVYVYENGFSSRGAYKEIKRIGGGKKCDKRYRKKCEVDA